MTEKLEPQLEQIEIKQTRTFLEPIRFREDAINRVKNTQYKFNNNSFLFIPFKVSNDSHQKGLKLKIFKGTTEDSKINKKIFFIQYWFNGRPSKHKIGNYSQSFGVKECDEYLSKLHETHTDSRTGYYIKDPNETAKNDKRIVPKPDTTLTAGKTINEVIEDYCNNNHRSKIRAHLQ